MNHPIIQSLLDLDLYKPTMMQAAWRYFRNVPVKYEFRNRTTSVALADWVGETALRAELDHVQTLTFIPDELDYLRESKFIKRGLFKDDFLKFLGTVRLSDFYLARDDNQWQISPSGKWPEAKALGNHYFVRCQ